MLSRALLVTVLSAGAAEAQSSLDHANVLAATEDYLRTGRARVLQGGTYLMFPFGHTQPTLRCAPLRVCTIELEGGERILDDVAGDRTRWAIESARGPHEAPLVVVKPLGCGYVTNLVVSTDRRVYHFTLDSPPCSEDREEPEIGYTRHVKFYYPDALVRARAAIGRSTAVSAAQAAPDSDGAAVHQPAMGGPQRAEISPVDGVSLRATPAVEEPPPEEAFAVRDLDALNFAYRWRRDPGFPWVPEQVFDDGRRTCLRIPAEANRHDLPVLFELHAGGEMAVINYTVRSGCFLADRVMSAFVLVMGDGDARPRRLLITANQAKR
ncbi:MAG: TrbG/VirB9 family P-type conjugative transfer protein [Gemmatimonadota bacterium]|nr:TrbG/VirB9 family P-type conjugative transfer protein [Gemmatimonadota bacterium]